jgi:hypothetical protein
MELLLFEFQINVLMSYYRKLVETFHIVSEYKTAIYFSWSLIQALAQPVQLFDCWSLLSVAHPNSWTDLDLHLFIETEQDQTRLSFMQ